jgi:hypothetical protein
LPSASSHKSIAGHPDADEADLKALAPANTAATAEGVLAAVAIYLARQEANTPETR